MDTALCVQDATDELRPQIEHRGQSIKKSNEKHPCTEQDIETVPTTDEASNDVGTEKTEHIERVEDNGSLQEANTLNLRSTDQLLLENRDVESCCKECDELLRYVNDVWNPLKIPAGKVLDMRVDATLGRGSLIFWIVFV